MTGKVDGREITAREEPFSVVKEAWNEYVLESGVRVRVKASVGEDWKVDRRTRLLHAEPVR